ncbi:hypothetical protein [Nocardia jiangxiensis]|uniref:hypothetical protein n=1 Tax=Nocardia jiangxiensis TaxID=282685 RepID=UPI0012F684D9|nr:hypothetical protein [Nocardia jiangxiensis]
MTFSKTNLQPWFPFYAHDDELTGKSRSIQPVCTQCWLNLRGKRLCEGDNGTHVPWTMNAPTVNCSLCGAATESGLMAEVCRRER